MRTVGRGDKRNLNVRFSLFMQKANQRHITNSDYTILNKFVIVNFESQRNFSGTNEGSNSPFV